MIQCRPHKRKRSPCEGPPVAPDALWVAPIFLWLAFCLVTPPLFRRPASLGFTVSPTTRAGYLIGQSIYTLLASATGFDGRDNGP